MQLWIYKTPPPPPPPWINKPPLFGFEALPGHLWLVAPLGNKTPPVPPLDPESCCVWAYVPLGPGIATVGRGGFINARGK